MPPTEHRLTSVTCYINKIGSFFVRFRFVIVYYLNSYSSVFLPHVSLLRRILPFLKCLVNYLRCYASTLLPHAALLRKIAYTLFLTATPLRLYALSSYPRFKIAR